MRNEFNHHTCDIIAKIMTFRNKLVLITMFRIGTCNEVIIKSFISSKIKSDSCTHPREGSGSVGICWNKMSTYIIEVNNFP
jgi:hypothetical protein